MHVLSRTKLGFVLFLLFWQLSTGNSKGGCLVSDIFKKGIFLEVRFSNIQLVLKEPKCSVQNVNLVILLITSKFERHWPEYWVSTLSSLVTFPVSSSVENLGSHQQVRLTSAFMRCKVMNLLGRQLYADVLLYLQITANTSLWFTVMGRALPRGGFRYVYPFCFWFNGCEPLAVLKSGGCVSMFSMSLSELWLCHQILGVKYLFLDKISLENSKAISEQLLETISQWDWHSLSSVQTHRKEKECEGV